LNDRTSKNRKSNGMRLHFRALNPPWNREEGSTIHTV